MLNSFFRWLQQALKVAAKIWVVVSSVIGSLILILFFVIIAAALHGKRDSKLQQPTISRKQLRAGGSSIVAVVNLNGPIVEEAGESDPLAGGSALVVASRVDQILDNLANDSSVKAVVLRMNTPGGTVVASDEIYQHVRALRARKPVVASMEDVTASGGYYIAAGSSHIVANPGTITGSIGVIAQFPKLAGLYDKLGIDMRVIKSGEFKDIGSPNRDMSADEKTILNGIVQDAYHQFVTAVADGRKMEYDKVQQLADGRIYSGKQAKDNGLVDELGNFDAAVTTAEKLASVHNAQVVEYNNQSLFEALFQSKLGLGPLKSLSNVVAAPSFKVYYMLDM